jgi:hypothetical protein
MAKEVSQTVELSLVEVRQWIHDLRNSLHAINIGVELLARVRNDDKRFYEVQRLMTEEHGKAMARLEAVSAAMPSGDSPSG